MSFAFLVLQIGIETYRNLDLSALAAMHVHLPLS